MNVCTYPAPWESLTVGVGSFLCKQLPALTQQNLPANCNNHAWVRFAENLRKICWIIGRKAASVHHTKPALQKLPVAVKTNMQCSICRQGEIRQYLTLLNNQELIDLLHQTAQQGTPSEKNYGIQGNTRACWVHLFMGAFFWPCRPCNVTAVSLHSMRSQWRAKMGPFNKALHFNCVRGSGIIFAVVPVTRI